MPSKQKKWTAERKEKYSPAGVEARQQRDQEMLGALARVIAKEEDRNLVRPAKITKRLMTLAGGPEGVANMLWAAVEKAKDSKNAKALSDAMVAIMRILEKEHDNQPPALTPGQMTDVELFTVVRYIADHFDALVGPQSAATFGQQPARKDRPRRSRDRVDAGGERGTGGETGGTEQAESAGAGVSAEEAGAEQSSVREVSAVDGESADQESPQLDQAQPRQPARGTLDAALNGWFEDVPGAADGA